MKSMLKRMLSDRGGTTAIEYSLIAAVFALAGIVGWSSFGGSMGEMYNRVSATISVSVDSNL